MRAATVTMRPGDVLLLATDGVDASFADSLQLSGSSQTISERILSDHWKPPDDALVIVVRYLGARP
jgi:negative regulator of sigma-B (phosphoserine phosphatase)